MRNLLALVGLLVIVGGGVGWYTGWLKISVSRGNDGNLEIKTDVDTKKVGSELNNLGSNIGNRVEQGGTTSPPAGAPGAIPGPAAPGAGSPFNPLAPTVPDAPVAPIPSVGPLPPMAPVLPAGGAYPLVPPN